MANKAITDVVDNVTDLELAAFGTGKAGGSWDQDKAANPESKGKTYWTPKQEAIVQDDDRNDEFEDEYVELSFVQRCKEKISDFDFRIKNILNKCFGIKQGWDDPVGLNKIIRVIRATLRIVIWIVITGIACYAAILALSAVVVYTYLKHQKDSGQKAGGSSGSSSSPVASRRQPEEQKGTPSSVFKDQATPMEPAERGRHRYFVELRGPTRCEGVHVFGDSREHAMMNARKRYPGLEPTTVKMTCK